MESLSSSERVLLWVVNADVQSMRALVRLARHCSATLHVGSSTGREVFKRVALVEGWNGSSLAEAAHAADVIITIGDGLLANAPLLPERFLGSTNASRDRKKWFHIGAEYLTDKSLPVAPDRLFRWKRTQWLDRFIELNQSLRQSNDHRHDLAIDLLQAQNVSLIIDTDEWTSELDELVLLQIQALVAHLNRSARCTVISLEQNVGRLTAEETVRWLTGYSPTVSCDNGRCCSVDLGGKTLDEIRTRYDQVILIRTLPTVVPFPAIEPDLILAPELYGVERDHCLDRWLPIATVGGQASGHVFRGDGGMQVLLESPTLERLPTSTADNDQQSIKERWTIVDVVDWLLAIPKSSIVPEADKKDGIVGSAKTGVSHDH